MQRSPALPAVVDAPPSPPKSDWGPIRKLLPDFGGLDFSPMVILLLIMVVQKLLSGVAMDVTASAV